MYKPFTAWLHRLWDNIRAWWYKGYDFGAHPRYGHYKDKNNSR